MRVARSAGSDARDHGHADADEQRDDDGARRAGRVARRQVEARPPRTTATMPGATSRPPARPSSAATVPTSSASSTTDVEHLPARRAERAQQRELLQPLGDRDRERVGDDERADEDRDAAEDEQRGAQEAEVLLLVGRSPGRRSPGRCARRRRSPRSAARTRVAQLLGRVTPRAGGRDDLRRSAPTVSVIACASRSVMSTTVAPASESTAPNARDADEAVAPRRRGRRRR